MPDTKRGGRPHLVIAGASGVVGRLLVRAAVPRWRVTVLTRNVDGSEPAGVAAVAWRPDAARRRAGDELRALSRVLDGADALVNLAGASIDRGRFGAKHRRRVMESRLDATATLLAAFEATATAPAVWFQASAVGIYGDRGEEVLTEASATDDEFFLGRVCRAWEAAAAPAARRARLVVGRQGMVLDREAAAWRKLTLPVRLGVGGPLGGGRQWWSWIHGDDLAAAMLYLIEERPGGRPPEGVYALTAPAPTRQIELTREIARILRRPSLLPVPAAALRVAVGGLADMLLLPSARVVPERLREEGFAFRYPTVGDAAEALLGDGSDARRGRPATQGHGPDAPRLEPVGAQARGPVRAQARAPVGAQARGEDDMATGDSRNDPPDRPSDDEGRRGAEPIPQGGVTEKDDAPAARLEQERVIPELTHQDFRTRPIEELADRVGLTPPGPDEDEAAWREKAWQSHAQDLANRDEWGTATQVTEPPEGEDPNL